MRLSIVACILLAGAAAFAASPKESHMTEPALKDAFRNRFLVGAALAPAIFLGRAPAEQELVVRQMNAVSPENALKWGPIHPRPDAYDWRQAQPKPAFYRVLETAADTE